MTSAAEHAFGKGEPLTLGVEEEYMLLDATTFELCVALRRGRRACSRAARSTGARTPS